jgi:hypothetical protein
MDLAVDDGCVDRSGADDIRSNLAVFQFSGPCTGEGADAAFVAL